MCEGKEYDEKSDIWALGCILGEMCMKQKSFAASNLSELVSRIMTVISSKFQIVFLILMIPFVGEVSATS